MLEINSKFVSFQDSPYVKFSSSFFLFFTFLFLLLEFLENARTHPPDREWVVRVRQSTMTNVSAYEKI
jgi:hypothetical protein